MTRHRHRAPLVLALVLAPLPALGARCDLNGQEVNTDNGSTTAGKSGILKCYRDGKLWREQELRDGEYLGLDRRYDDDGSMTERQVNKNGNSEGPAKEWYPNHQIKSELTYQNGSLVGLARSYWLDGQLKSVSYYEKAGDQPGVRIEYSSNGKPTDLRCATRTLVPEDKYFCGFGKRMDVVLYTPRDEKREERTMLDGKAIAAKEFDRAGKVTESFEATAKGRIERRYHPDGKVALESVIENDYRVAQTEWYMNGAVKTKTVTEPVDRRPKSTVESYRDTGVLEARQQYRGDTRLAQQVYDEAGKPSEEFTYDDDGNAKTHRKFAAGGEVVLDEEFYPDGSRKVKTAGPKVSAPEK